MRPCPLIWPEGVPRSTSHQRAHYRVTSFARARAALILQVELYGGNAGIVVTTNTPVHADGNPIKGAPESRDRGVAVYWMQLRHNAPPLRCHVQCDKWTSVVHNMRELELYLERKRGVDRSPARLFVEEVDGEAELAGLLAAGGAR